MAKIDLNLKKDYIDDGKDSIVNVKVNADLSGGTVLDTSTWGEDVIRAGHVIIRNTTTLVCSPLDIENGAYVTLPEGCEYLGTLIKSVLTNKPSAAICLAGVINTAASPYPITNEIKEGLTTIKFI